MTDASAAVVLFRLRGRPLGWGAGRVTDGRLDVPGLVHQFLRDQSWSCAVPLAERAIHSGRPVRTPDFSQLLHAPELLSTSGPLVTVAVRSRAVAARLRPCLDSLLALDYAPLDLVFIDASDDRRRVEALIRDHYPQIRYRSAIGFGTATRVAIAECRGDILAVTDGDAVVDPQWIAALVHVFLADPDVMVVNGLVVPRALHRPFRPALPAGAPFARLWWREGREMFEGATERAVDRASSNVAYWRPASPTSSRYTRVWEPAAIVRSTSAVPTPQLFTNAASARVLDRTIDLADGAPFITDAAGHDGLRLHVAWAGAPVGSVHIPHQGAVVSRLWIEDAVAQQLTVAVLDAGLRFGPDVVRALLTADLLRDIVSRWEPAFRDRSTPPNVRTAA